MGFYGLAASLVLVWSVAVGAVAYSKGSASRNQGGRLGAWLHEHPQAIVGATVYSG